MRSGPYDDTDGGDLRHYELRVEGHLDRHRASAFAGLTLTHEDDATTSLRGPVADQAKLHGHLARVRDLGVTLVSVTALDEHRAARTRQVASGS